MTEHMAAGHLHRIALPEHDTDLFLRTSALEVRWTHDATTRRPVAQWVVVERQARVDLSPQV